MKNMIEEKIRPILQEYGVKTAILFGSFAKGTESDKSDVDLLVNSGLKGLSFVGLIEDIRDALDGRDVDIIDTSHIERGSRVEREIMENGILIYEK